MRALLGLGIAAGLIVLALAFMELTKLELRLENFLPSIIGALILFLGSSAIGHLFGAN